MRAIFEDSSIASPMLIHSIILSIRLLSMRRATTGHDSALRIIKVQSNGIGVVRGCPQLLVLEHHRLIAMHAREHDDPDE